MFLRTLTLRGFKSFAEKTVLELEPGITVIVGPNGSGKSNIVDAIAWVLGEQGPKSLRGGKMDDVIFGGAGNRGPLGRAEVALTIDNGAGLLGVEYSEISITRLLYRSGDSDYAINGSSCRLMDIQELLSDTGVGRELHTIVGQGHLDDILHGSAGDRRAAIEEAAGIYKHRRRKDRALRKLSGIEQQMVRISDLVGEMRRQLKPLQQQAEAAKRAAELAAELREVRLTEKARELRAARAARHTAETRRAALADSLAEAERAHAEAQALEADATEKLAAAEPAAGRARETAHRLVTVRERLRGTLALAEERARGLAQPPLEERTDRAPAELLREADAALDDTERIGAELDARRGDLEQAHDAEQAAKAALDAHDAEVAHAVRQRAAAREQALQRAAAAERARAAARERTLRLQGDAGGLRQLLERHAADAEQLAAEQEELTAQAAAAAEALARHDADAAAAETERAALAETLETAKEAHARAAERLAALTERRRQLEAERGRARGRREAHEAAVQAASRAVEALAAGHPDGLLGPLAPALAVEEGYEAAVAAALGPDAHAVVAAAAPAALAAVGFLRETSGGRATFLFAPDGHAPPDGDAPVGVAPEQLLRAHVRTTGPAAAAVVEALLAGVLVADHLEDAQRLHARHPGARVVTRGGELLARGRVEGGAAPDAGALAAQQAAQAASADEQDAQDALDRLAGDLDAAQAAEQAAAAAAADAAQRASSADARLAAGAQTRDRARADHRAVRRDQEALAARQAGLAERRDRDQARLADLERQLAAAPGEPPAGEEPPEDAALQDAGLPPEPDPDARVALAEALERATEQAVQARLELSALTERHRLVADRERALRQRAAAEAEAQLRRAATEAARLAGADRATGATRAAGRVLVALERSLATATTERDELLGQVAAGRKQLAGATERRRTRTQELERLGATARDADTSHVEARMRDDELARRLTDEFGADPDETIGEYAPDSDALDDLPEQDPRRLPEAELRRLATALERRLTLLGRVNPLALEDYKALEERHAFLAGQLADLKDSRRDLLKVVRAVDARVREVFTQAYSDVAREFQHTFDLLFPGGEGRLILTDPEDMLASGVEIEARPPGKRLRRLSLLSGGERSLVALAYCFAIFRARPSPFYVLDEVEAALDDVNLQRFLHLLEDMRDRAQLLVVSHQRRTMEAADALYGVSMRGNGVSMVLSQKLNSRRHRDGPDGSPSSDQGELDGDARDAARVGAGSAAERG